MILGLELPFHINGKKQIAYSLKNKKGKLKVNGTEFACRIPVKAQDLREFDFEKSEVMIENPVYPLESGKWQIKYNDFYYYVTYLDELELFKQVVVRHEPEL